MPNSQPAYSIRDAHWPDDQTELMHVRHEVFVIEQSVPAELEQDASDPDFRHVLALDSNSHPIGTGRVSECGKIGRMAVLRSWRSHGVGSAILARLIEIAAGNGCQTVKLSAQLTAVPFYQRHGFTESGDVYQEANIDHIKMTRSPSAN